MEFLQFIVGALFFGLVLYFMYTRIKGIPFLPASVKAYFKK